MLIGIGAIVGVFIAGTAVLQHRLLYFPTPASIAQMSSSGMTPWPDAGQFLGLLSAPVGDGLRDTLPPASAGASATVLLFHGNAGHAAHRAYYAHQLSSLGLRVILAEYPGYGPRAGKLGEQSLVDDAEQTILKAHQHFGAPLLLVGESLGAAVAAAAAARVPDKIHGLLLITPWDRLAHVAAHHYPWLPVKWLLQDRYDTMFNLQAFDRPVVVVLAERDAIVPARLGSALYESLNQPKKLLVLKGVGHNDWPDVVDAKWWRTTIDGLLADGLLAAD